MSKEKRVLSIQDYSVMGRCSLTVALPTLSALGYECVGLPTAVLSNHTRFRSWTYTDLTSELIPMVGKWDDYNHRFDAIQTGYLGDNQVSVIIEIINKLKTKDTLVLVDPAMADNGRLYAGFADSHVAEMKKLMKYADLTCPNITEASLLTGLPYHGEALSKEEAEELLNGLLQLGPSKAVLSGIVFPNGMIGCAYKEKDQEMKIYKTKDLHVSCHGTGDLFAAALLGAFLKTSSLAESVKVAHDYVHESIIQSVNDGLSDMETYGVDFEKAIPYLLNDLNLG